MKYHALLSVIRDFQSYQDWSGYYDSLLPGAYAALLVTRQSADFIAVGMRRAGFAFRDTIHVFQAAGSRACLLFKRPNEESTGVKQVLKTGTGGLNINATRVRHSSLSDFEDHKSGVDKIRSKGGSMANSWKNSSDLSGANEVTMAGRWPSNLVFVHDITCRLLGSRRVDAPVINRFTDGAKPFGNGAGHPYESIQTGDADGKESIPVYECSPACAVRAMNEQSGNRPATLTGRADPNEIHENPGDNHGASWFGGGNSQVYADEGGAARYFSQFQSEEELLAWIRTLVCPEGGTLLDLTQGHAREPVSPHDSAA